MVNKSSENVKKKKEKKGKCWDEQYKSKNYIHEDIKKKKTEFRAYLLLPSSKHCVLPSQFQVLKITKYKAVPPRVVSYGRKSWSFSLKTKLKVYDKKILKVYTDLRSEGSPVSNPL